MPNRIDINCDMGESFGVYTLGRDAEVMDYISSANIACGWHAGDPLVMEQTVRLAKEKEVAVGAHPGYPDLLGFGRRRMDLSPGEIEAYLLYQMGALAAFAKAQGLPL
ncbi:MAG: LamB/YcsF family protein, partial [Deltaproteobacteria bacterium]